MILLAAFVALVGRDCAAGDYKNVRFGPYTDSAQEASANGNLAPLVEDFRGATNISHRQEKGVLFQ